MTWGYIAAAVIAAAVTVYTTYQSTQQSKRANSRALDQERLASQTGELTGDEAQGAARKRAYRSGVLFTSPTGIGSTPQTASAKLR